MREIILAETTQADDEGLSIGFARVTATVDGDEKILLISASSEGNAHCGFGTKTATSMNLEYGVNDYQEIDVSGLDFYLTDGELPEALELYVGLTSGN